MRPSDFAKIENFFKDHGHSPVIARFAFSKFIENVQSIMEEEKKRLGKELTDDQVQQISNNFLNPPILRQYLELALVEKDLEEKAIARKFDKSAGVLHGIWIGVLSNFAFMILLLFIYAGAKDQAKSLLENLGITEQQKPSVPKGTGTKPVE